MNTWLKISNKLFPIVAGIGLFILAAIGVVGVMKIPKPIIDDAVGPRLLPAAAALFLLILAMGFTQAAYQGRCPDAADDPEMAPRPGGAVRGGWLLAGLAALMGLLATVGIGAAGTVGFALFAQAFGSRSPLKALFIGFLFSLAIWLLFDQALGVKLGPFLSLAFLFPAG